MGPLSSSLSAPNSLRLVLSLSCSLSLPLSCPLLFPLSLSPSLSSSPHLSLSHSLILFPLSHLLSPPPTPSAWFSLFPSLSLYLSPAPFCSLSLSPLLSHLLPICLFPSL